MYAYNRFWNAQKAMLLYPGESKNNSFKPFETEDFFRDNDQTTSITHLCKSGFVSVLGRRPQIKSYNWQTSIRTVGMKNGSI